MSRATDTALVAARRDRVLAAMADRDLDVLVLGRQDDANYASGMHRLWTAGTRPFGAGCLVVRETGRTHVLSGWDAGLPATMTWDDLYPSTWNPRIMSGHLAAIPGLSTARRIGVDEMSPSFGRAASRLAPDAAVVPADDLMAAVRRRKLPAEVDLIRAACLVAWEGVMAVARHPDRSDDERVGAALAAMARHGATIPSSAPVVRTHGAETLVDLGVIVAGYEGGKGGVIRAELAARGETGELDPHVGALIDACVPGTTGANLAAVAPADTGWLVRGLGMGFEQPVVDRSHGHGVALEEDMVLSVAAGAHREVVHVTAAGPVVLSRHPTVDT